MKRLYPFDDWFSRPPNPDGRVRLTLVQGEHYSVSQSSICQQLRMAACARGLRITVSDQGDRVLATVVGEGDWQAERQAVLDAERESRVTYQDERAAYRDDLLRSRERNA